MRTRLERETIITYNELEPTARIWSVSDKVIKKLQKMGYVPIFGTKESKTFEVPKQVISIRKTQTRKPMSSKQLKEAKERLKNARLVRKSQNSLVTDS